MEEGRPDFHESSCDFCMHTHIHRHTCIHARCTLFKEMHHNILSNTNKVLVVLHTNIHSYSDSWNFVWRLKLEHSHVSALVRTLPRILQQGSMGKSTISQPGDLNSGLRFTKVWGVKPLPRTVVWPPNTDHRLCRPSSSQNAQVSKVFLKEF